MGRRHKRMSTGYLCIAFVCLLTGRFIEGSNPPSFPSEDCYIYGGPGGQSEYTITGTVLQTFTVTDADAGDEIIVTPADAVTDELIIINQTYGNNNEVQLILRSQLDCDPPKQRQVDLKFLAEDTPVAGNSNNKVYYVCVLYIKDENDIPPTIHNQPFSWKLNETVGSRNSTQDVFAFYATDRDYTSSNNYESIMYTMRPNTQSPSLGAQYNDTFGIKRNGTLSEAMHGYVYLRADLDYETNTYYQFTIFATDANGTGNATSADLVISVQDLQDTPPFFTGSPYRITIPESLPEKSHVITVNAMDGDRGIPNKINYTLEDTGGACVGLFDIDPTNGTIRSKDVIDRDSPQIDEQGGICVLRVKAQEIDERPKEQHGNTTVTTEVTITISDVNDEVPQFEQPSYFAEIQENSPEGVPITMANGTDIYVSDGDDQGASSTMNLTLHFENNTLCTYFEITPNPVKQRGSVMLRVKDNSILDYEQNNMVKLIVNAIEQANSSHTATTTVFINITDMNDNNPQFTKATYKFELDENSDNNTVIGHINATDADSGTWGKVRYSLSGANGRFHIDSTSGNLSIICQTNCSDEFDFERIQTFYLTVTATDEGDRSNSTALEIQLLDVNDNPPTFTRTFLAFVNENDDTYNYPSGTPVLTVEAQDLDQEGSNNSEIRFTILDSQNIPSDNLTLNVTSGQLYLTTPIDYEDDKVKDVSGVLNIIVQAEDLGTPCLVSNTTVVITVRDENDNPPVFNDTRYHVNVLENVTSAVNNLAVVGSLYAEDHDGTEVNSRFQFFIVNGSDNSFTINITSGDLAVQINSILDRETQDTYNITVIAIDQGAPPRTGTTVYAVTVSDINDENPSFTKGRFDASVYENTTDSVNQIFITCSATDPDENSKLLYSIETVDGFDESGAKVNESLIKDYFAIHSNNGSVYVNAENTLPDREKAETIVITVKVEDEHADKPKSQNATVLLTINLLDINDNPPDFSVEFYNKSVMENAANLTILTTVYATDKDKNRTITYSITDTDPRLANQSFSIDPVTGVFRKNGNLDREEIDSIVVYVNATDNGVPALASTVALYVNILDFNDNDPEFVDDIRVFNVSENETFGYEVYRMNATDADEGRNAKIVYIIEQGEDTFVINNISGVLTVNNTLDREKVAQYQLRIQARDDPQRQEERRSTIRTITINIGDVNDNAPEFESDYSAIIAENIGYGVSIVTVTATDKDIDENAELLYYLSGDPDTSGLFVIDPLTGVVSTNTSLEEQSGTYTLIVTAQDQGEPKKNGSTNLNITVLDVNLNYPVIVDIPVNNTIKVYECQPISVPFYTFKYTDKDSGLNGEATFNISDSNDDITVEETFTLHLNGSLALKKALNSLEKQSYVFQIIATDKGDPPRRSEVVRIHIRVIDVDDHLPSFESNRTTFYIEENRINTQVGIVTAVDPDLDSVSCYKILDGVHKDSFTVGNTTGIITTVKEFDYEAIKETKITVHVVDCSISTGDDCANATEKDTGLQEQIVIVKILDVNDNPPRFIQKEITTGMRRVTNIETVLDTSLKDSVTDNDTLLANTEHSWFFNIAGPVSSTVGVAVNSGTKQCDDGIKHIICISGNGSIINNKYFSEDSFGYIEVPVNVSDVAGWDVATLKIFLIGDSQILRMVIFESKEEVDKMKYDILQLYSKITRKNFTYDWLEDHKTDSGNVDTLKTDLYFHVVDPETQRVLSAEETLRLVDDNSAALFAAMEKYKVLQVVGRFAPSKEEDNSTRTIYILMAVIIVLSLTVMIIIYVSLTTRSKYQRKLQAVTVRADDIDKIKKEAATHIPGCNVYAKNENPLLGADLIEKPALDSVSIASYLSLDSNMIGCSPEFAHMEEKEVTMDMYTEDTYATTRDDPLDAALRLHDLQNVKEKPDNTSTEGIVIPDNDLEGLSFTNFTFDQTLESTEI